MKKKLIIVGNQENLNYDFSDFVNSSDYVIRFNRMQNFNKNTGNKTNEIYFRVKPDSFIWGFDENYNFLFENDIDISNVLVNFNYRKLEKNFLIGLDKIYKKYNLGEAKILCTSNLNIYKKNYGSPSLGKVALETILKSDLYKDYHIYLLGFNWKNNDTNIGHTWKLEKSQAIDYQQKNLITIINDNEENYNKFNSLNDLNENDKKISLDNFNSFNINNIFYENTNENLIELYNLFNSNDIFSEYSSMIKKHKLKLKNYKNIHYLFKLLQNLKNIHENDNLKEVLNTKIKEINYNLEINKEYYIKYLDNNIESNIESNIVENISSNDNNKQSDNELFFNQNLDQDAILEKALNEELSSFNTYESSEENINLINYDSDNEIKSINTNENEDNYNSVLNLINNIKEQLELDDELINEKNC